jgi:hypothetical protein
VTASLAERVSKKFGLLHRLWATEDEIFSEDGEEVERQPFPVKDLRRRAHWGAEKSPWGLRASTPRKWIEGWVTNAMRVLPVHYHLLALIFKGMPTVCTDLGHHAGGGSTKNAYFVPEPDGDNSPARQLVISVTLHSYKGVFTSFLNYCSSIPDPDRLQLRHTM